MENKSKTPCERVFEIDPGDNGDYIYDLCYDLRRCADCGKKNKEHDQCFNVFWSLSPLNDDSHLRCVTDDPLFCDICKKKRLQKLKSRKKSKF